VIYLLVIQFYSLDSANPLETFIQIFQAKKPQPTVYLRCLLQSVSFGGSRSPSSTSIQQVVFDDLVEVVLPADVLVDPANAGIDAPNDDRFKIAQTMDKFVTQASQVNISVAYNRTNENSRNYRTTLTLAAHSL
jgi:N-alpha-acetyltransferase 35, NatC auxiliary subunit